MDNRISKERRKVLKYSATAVTGLGILGTGASATENTASEPDVLLEGSLDSPITDKEIEKAKQEVSSRSQTQSIEQQLDVRAKVSSKSAEIVSYGLALDGEGNRVHSYGLAVDTESEDRAKQRNRDRLNQASSKESTTQSVTTSDASDPSIWTDDYKTIDTVSEAGEIQSSHNLRRHSDNPDYYVMDETKSWIPLDNDTISGYSTTSWGDGSGDASDFTMVQYAPGSSVTNDYSETLTVSSPPQISYGISTTVKDVEINNQTVPPSQEYELDFNDGSNTFTANFGSLCELQSYGSQYGKIVDSSMEGLFGSFGTSLDHEIGYTG